MKCKQCNKEINGKNKKYCSKECRYKDSWFKSKVPWNKSKTRETSELVNKISIKKGKTLKKRYKSGDIKIWNKGLTKDTNKSLKNISNSRKGRNNPIFKVIDDPEKYEKWSKNLSKALKGKRSGTLEKQFGKERAIEIKNILSKAAKKRKIHGHTGIKHSDESKQKMREATSKRIKDRKFKITDTEPMRIFSKFLKELKLENFIKEYCDINYSIDFAFVENKIAIEIDGDFWHANPNKYPNGPIHKIQIKNKRIEKNKEIWLIKRGWKIFRFWEFDIKNNKEMIINKLLEIKKENSL